MSQKVKYIAMLVVALLLLGVGYDMQRLTDASGFWGPRPLFFLLLLTAFFTPLMFVGFVPLLVVENEIRKFAEKPFWKIALYSYHSFLVWNILSTYWVSNSTLGGGIFANFTNAALMTIPFMLYSFCKAHLKPSLHAWAFIGFWICYEKLDQYWELTWTWLTLGNSLAQYPSWAQWYSFTGVFGGTFWILLTNYLLYQLITKYKIWNLTPQRLLQPILLFVIPLLLSLGMYVMNADQGPQKKVLVVQPNFEPHYEKFTIPIAKQFEKIQKQIDSKIDAETDYVLLPETVLRQLNLSQGKRHTYVKMLEENLAQYPNLKVVSGAGAYLRSRDPEEFPKRSRRTYNRDTKPFYVEAYNAAIQFSSDVDTLQFYKKSILVPGTEIFPYSKLFPFMEGMINSMGGTVAGNGTQAYRSVFWDADRKHAIAPVICYESIYGEYCAEYIRKGANAIFILTNDGWWDDSPGFRQHLKFASLRAIETRRSIARSANTGSSCYINQRGDILEATDYEVDAVLNSSIAFNDQITFYTRWGDFIARISILVSILLFLSAFVHKFSKKSTQN